MKKILGLLILVLFFTSCEKMFFDKEISSKSPQVNFDYLWQKCYENYSFFEYKNIDWHEVKTRYQSKIDNSLTNEDLFNILADMLRELRDAHTNLYSNLNISFFPIQKLGPDNFEWRTITDNYLPSNYQITGPFRHDYLTNQNIGYIRYASFMGDISEIHLDHILKRYANTDGIIIDIRENGGGAAANVFKLLSRFIDKKTLVYFSRYKNGPNPNDFSDYVPAYIEPSEKVKYLKNVILLTDRSTYSAGSFTTLAAKAINKITIIGDTTGGGLGIPNGGQLPNGWTYRFSVSQAVDLNQNNFEDGVPPDIVSYFDWSNLNIDEVIERAIQEINK